MRGPFIGSEALAQGMPWGELQRRHTRVFRGVYVPADSDVGAVVLAKAAWLWSRRRGVVAGLAASALHGSKWVDSGLSVDLYHDNRHRLPGLMTRSERLSKEEICLVDNVPVTTPARTAVDLGCWYPRVKAIAAVDALVRATALDVAEAVTLADRQGGRRGILRARRVLGLADAGSQSPKESWLRTVLIDGGLPMPQTQIPIHDEWGKPVAYLDMGWEEMKVAVEYDGEHHRTDRRQYSWDVRRLEMLQRQGWIIVRVTAEDSADNVLRRVRAALASRR
jgi:hypothetical protein